MRVREIHTENIVASVRQLCIDANFQLRDETLHAYRCALEDEVSCTGQEVLRTLLRNAQTAKEQKLPLCQDTGFAVLFIEVGQDVHIVGAHFNDAVNEGVRQGYGEGYLRKSLVRNAIERINTGDNTPAGIHVEIVPGEQIRITLLVKGAGCDNVSALKMFTPAEGLEAAKDFIVETVDRAGPNASPPVVIGVGLGGTFAQAALLAQKALLWPISKLNPDPLLAGLEKELTARINALGIGPAGYGGRVTTFGIHIESFATHIASFPVAVNVDCSAHRVRELIL